MQERYEILNKWINDAVCKQQEQQERGKASISIKWGEWKW